MAARRSQDRRLRPPRHRRPQSPWYGRQDGPVPPRAHRNGIRYCRPVGLSTRSTRPVIQRVDGDSLAVTAIPRSANAPAPCRRLDDRGRRATCRCHPLRRRNTRIPAGRLRLRLRSRSPRAGCPAEATESPHERRGHLAATIHDPVCHEFPSRGPSFGAMMAKIAPSRGRLYSAMPIGAPASPVWSESTGMPPDRPDDRRPTDAEEPELTLQPFGGDRNVDGPPIQREPVPTSNCWVDRYPRHLRTCPSMLNATMAPAGAATFIVAMIEAPLRVQRVHPNR